VPRSNVAALKDQAVAAIRARRDAIVALAEDLWRMPELGFREERTAARVAGFLADLGLPVRTGLALTGVKAVVSGRSPNSDDAALPRPPRVAVLGELDAITCPGHPSADPLTGAAHACGHHAQLAVLAGVAIGLTAPGVLDGLGGSVAFFAVPAEEYVEIEYRLSLRQQGKIEFLGGKPELLRLGEFDDVDMAILVHGGGIPGPRLSVGGTSNGFIGKFVRYYGREAHAGAAPWTGANALSSAMLALAGINALRETFRDEDSIRVHPIVTKGGDLVNIVPADVRLETYVRGRSIAAIRETSAKIDRAFQAGALTMDTKVEIQDLPGFLPMRANPRLADLYRRNLEWLVGVENVIEGGHMAGSTDMGDISHVMPALHPYGAGVEGRPHSTEFRVVDAERAYLTPAFAVAALVIDLLSDGAREAEAIRRQFRPEMSRAAYIEFSRSLFRRVVYPERG
jgi:amidohydrolase